MRSSGPICSPTTKGRSRCFCFPFVELSPQSEHTFQQWHLVPVGQRSDDQSRRVAQVFIGVEKLSVANVGKTMLLLFIPTVSQLREPHKGLRIIHLGREKE